jgi:hypothetical protein
LFFYDFFWWKVFKNKKRHDLFCDVLGGIVGVVFDPA